MIQKPMIQKIVLGVNVTLLILFVGAYFLMPDGSEQAAVEQKKVVAETLGKVELAKADPVKEVEQIGVPLPPAKKEENNKVSIPTTAPQAGDANVPEGNHIQIDLENGVISIELYSDVAPNTVASFKTLAAAGFYDGLTFHRVIPDFMAQGGDPDGNGTGGPGYQVKAEFNAKKHVRGTLAMARSSSPDSAGSQFYICYGDTPHLDGQYTIFGQVTEGMELIDEVTNGTVMLKVAVLP
ncbi:MAG: peptidylprolyl isomerase [Mariprofundaceae bacterium]